MRFVGHLDLMRYFQRALRRAGFDLAYSEGFSPHPLMSFALPLGIGMTSEGEYLDITLHTTSPSAEAIRTLNGEMVDGVTVTEYILLPEGCRNAMASVAAADYFVYFKHGEDFTQSEILSGIEAYYSARDVIEVTKVSKKGERVIDLKPFIYRIEPCTDDGADSVPGTRSGFFLRLRAGSSDNIRPELVLEDFYRFYGREYDPFNLQIHRLELFEETSEGFSPLYRSGELLSGSDDPFSDIP